MSKPEKGYKKEVFRALALISQLGISVMVPTFLCLAIGVFLDKKFDTCFTIPLLIAGILAGGRNAYKLAKGVVGDTKKDKQ